MGKHRFTRIIPWREERHWEYGYDGVEVVPGESRRLKLTRNAKAAYVVRCASRVHPDYHRFWPDSPLYLSQVLDNILAHAADLAENQKGYGDPPHWCSIDSLFALAQVARIEARRYAPASGPHASLHAAANTLEIGLTTLLVADPKMTRGMLGSPRDRSEESFKGDFDAFAAQHCHLVVSKISAVGILVWQDWEAFRPEYTEAMRTDFETLERLCDRGDLAPDDPVPQSIFGPLWPAGGPRLITITPEDWRASRLPADPVWKAFGAV